jgi:Zn-dependent protease with chaperone function
MTRLYVGVIRGRVVRNTCPGREGGLVANHHDGTQDDRDRSAAREWALIAAMTALAHPIVVFFPLLLFGAARFFGDWGLLAPFIAWTTFAVLGAVTNRGELPGRPLRALSEPALGDLVRRVADVLHFQFPMTVRVIPVPDAALLPTRVSGMRAYALLLGLPFLQQLTAPQLAAVIAHELSHEQHIADRRSTQMMRARSGLSESRADLIRAPRSLVEALLKATQNGAWAAELSSDAASAEVVGTVHVQQALQRTAEMAAVFGTLGDTWTGVLAEEDCFPEDLYEAFHAAMADPYVLSRAADAVAEDESAEPDAGQDHPPLLARVAALPQRVAVGWGPERPLVIDTIAELRRWCVHDLLEGEPMSGDMSPARVLDGPPERFDVPVALAHEDLMTATERGSPAEAVAAAVDATADGTWEQVAHRIEPFLDGAPPELQATATRDVWVSCLGRALSGSLLATPAWRRASPWLTSVLISPSGAVTDLHDVVGQAADTGDTTVLRMLLAQSSEAASEQ